MLKHITVTFLYSLISYFCLSAKELSKYKVGICERVLDGDTIIVNNQKVRLFGLDAPELSQKDQKGFPVGRLSTNYLRSKIEGRWILYKFKGKGYYGRSLGIIYHNNQNINEELLKHGLAFPAFVKKEDSYFLLSYLAFSFNRGIFQSKDALIHPRAWRKRNEF